jgi:trigger factor
MQVTETPSEGLKREFQVVVSVEELGQRLLDRLNALNQEVRLKGFRPGKVPLEHLRRLYGRSAMAEIVQAILPEVARKTLSERGERAATSPDYKLPEDDEEAENVLLGKSEFRYTMVYEVLPSIALGDFKSLKIERPVAEVEEAEVERRLLEVADNARTYEAKSDAAAQGDRLTIAYEGKIDGEAFAGGSDQNASIRLGSGQFVPGFEDQLVGAKAGEQRQVTVTFPENYGAKHLAGKVATFDVTVKEVAAPQDSPLDDKLAERLGFKTIAEVRDTIRKQIETEYATMARQKLKRQVFDRLDELHRFDLPTSMVEQEFENIWKNITSELTNSGRSFETEGTTEEAAREDYRKIAERRVRLGLLLSEIGERQKIEVTEEEQRRALNAYLRQFPGRENVMLDYFRNNPDAVASLRAPIFEEKVVDYLLELADVSDVKVTRDELYREEEDERII